MILAIAFSILLDWQLLIVEDVQIVSVQELEHTIELLHPVTEKKRVELLKVT